MTWNNEICSNYLGVHLRNTSVSHCPSETNWQIFRVMLLGEVREKSIKHDKPNCIHNRFPSVNRILNN